MKLNPEDIPLMDKSTPPQSICPLGLVNPPSMQ